MHFALVPAAGSHSVQTPESESELTQQWGIRKLPVQIYVAQI